MKITLLVLLLQILYPSSLLPSTSVTISMAAAAVMVIRHVTLSAAIARSEMLSRLVEGSSVSLAQNGTLDEAARKSHMISRSDLVEALRQHGVDGLRPRP